MTDKSQRRDMRDIPRTDESRAAEKKAGEVPFNGSETRPQDPPEIPLSATKQ